ncbi:MAG: plastocyanin [Oleispira sp.]|jgi:plastocyanin
MNVKFITLLVLVVSLLSLPIHAAEIDVEIIKFKFIPQQLTINLGDTVVWTNKEKRQYHSIWFEALEGVEPDYLFPGEIYRRTFNQVGRFNYRCGPHPKMTGSVHVKQI